MAKGTSAVAVRTIPANASLASPYGGSAVEYAYAVQ